MDKAKNGSLPPLWEKMRVATMMLATILIPLVIALVGQSYTATLKQNELGARYVEMAIGILRAPPEPGTNSLRKWAIDIVNYNSKIPLSEEALLELQRPTSSVLF